MAIPPIEVEVLAKFDGFKRGMEDVRNDLDKTSQAAGRTKSAFEAAGAGIRKMIGPAKIAAAAIAAAGAATFGLASSTAKAGDNAAKTADRIGIGVEALQELRFAAERSGVASNTLDMALQRMTRRVAEAAQGSGEAKNALAELGLNAETLAAKSPDAALADIADAMQNVANQSDRVRLGFKLFDSEGVGLVNTLAGGSAGLEEMRQAARDTGSVISEDTARSSEQFQDKMQDLQASMAGLRTEIGEKLIPIFVEKVIPVLVDKVIPAIVSTINAISKIGPGIAAMKDSATASIEAVRATFDAWLQWFVDLPARFVQFGADVISGFQQGITDKFEEIKDSLTAPFRDFGANVKGFFGISSPSKLFKQFGAWVGEGFALGVEGQSGRIEDSAGAFEDFTRRAEDMVRKNRKIAAAEAFINAAKGAAQVIGDPTVPFFTKIGAAAAVFSAGKGFAQAIESGASASSGGGAAAGASAAAAPAQSQGPLQVSLAGLNADQLYEGGGIGRLLDRLNDEAGDRGYRILGVA